MTAPPNEAVVSTEADLTGYVPGEGDAYDYIPSWMNVPKLYQTEKQDVSLAVVKLFTPDSQWTWYVIEYDPQEKTVFGLVAGFEVELGYFSISEIEGVKGPHGLPIEHDLWFRPTPVTQLPEYRAKWGERGGPYKGTVETESETLTREEAQAILDQELEPDRNPAQILTVGMLDAAEQVMEAEIRDEDHVPLPEDWTVEDVAYLLEKLKQGPILVADSELGVPTIHNVASPIKHLGLGLMKVEGAGFTLHFDAGGAMQHTPSGKSWCFLTIEGERYSYDFAGVRATLEGYLASVGSDSGNGKVVGEGDAGLPIPQDMRELLYDGEVNLCSVDEVDPDKAAKLFTPFLPGGSQGPDKVFGHSDAEPWMLTRRQFQEREAETFAGGVPVLNVDDAREHECIVREALEQGHPVPDCVLADYPDLAEAEETLEKQNVPSGSLRIVYLDDVPDGIVWTGDTRSFQQYSEGSEGLRQAFDFLNAVRGYIEAAYECHVAAIQKDFGKGVHARVEPAKTGSERLQIAGWEGFDLSLTPSTEGSASELGYIIRNCYAEPAIPVTGEFL